MIGATCQLEEHKDRCCCNCAYQMAAFCHPWNEGIGQGRVTEVFGYLCAVPDFYGAGKRGAIFFENEHGLCEMHKRKTLAGIRDADEQTDATANCCELDLLR